MADLDGTDRDLLDQIEAECETALDLGMATGAIATLLRRFIEKIEMQRRGEKWWEQHG